MNDDTDLRMLLYLTLIAGWFGSIVWCAVGQ